MDSDILLAFRFMRMQINIDIKKYQQLCDKRKEAANKRWENHSKNANASFAMHKKENEIENENENEIENENENEKENEKENEREVVGRINSSSSSSTVSDIANGNEEEDEEENFSMMMKEKFLPWFNSILKNADSKIPRIQDFNDQRKEDLLRFTRNTESGRRGQQAGIQPQGQMIVVPKALLSDTGSIDFASPPH